MSTHQTGSTNLEKTQQIVLGGTLAALAHVTSYNPVKLNLELKSLLVFTAGALLGPRGGFATGLAVALLQGLFDPLGSAGMPLIVTFIVAFGGIGLAGGLLGASRLRRLRWWCPAMGVVAALYFDVVTCLPGPLIYGMDWRVTFVFQIPFSLTHAVANLLSFGYGLPLLLEIAARAGRGRPGWAPAEEAP